MSTDILTMSSKGQISIPARIRKEMDVSAGDKFVLYLHGDTIIMKPIKLPSITEFEKELKEAEKWAESVGYREEDVSEIIKSVRKNKSA